MERELRVTPLGVIDWQFITPEGVTLNLQKFSFQCTESL
jgi:hypothetical protein